MVSGIPAKAGEPEERFALLEAYPARKNRFLAQQQRRKRDIEHKVSRTVVDWAIKKSVGRPAVGDVRDIADGVDLGK